MRVYDVVKTMQDLRHLVWSERANTSGTAGCFLKSREVTSNQTWYYKLSCYDSYRGIYGHECVNEIIASRLMRILDVPHLEYKLIHAMVSIDGQEHETWLNRSASFRRPHEQKNALDVFYDLNKLYKESPLELCERFGWSDQVSKMMLVDYLIANRDRHGANIEVLQDADGGYRLAPLFDNGLSLVFSCYGDARRAAEFDPLQDVNANNYLGTRSLEENIVRFVSETVRVRELTAGHKEELLAGPDGAVPEAHLEKMWEIIWKRWCNLENLRNS